MKYSQGILGAKQAYSMISTVFHLSNAFGDNCYELPLYDMLSFLIVVQIIVHASLVEASEGSPLELCHVSMGN